MKLPLDFGPFELVDRISAGGMAEVFRARDKRSGNWVAVKRILGHVAEDQQFITMFEDEARIASSLEHPYIARMLDFGRIGASDYYIAFEYVHGRDLRAVFERLRKRGEKMPISVFLYLFIRLCEGLAYAHARKDERGFPVSIVHRDVSPQNIVVSVLGDVKLIDFGIAKAANKISRTQVGTIKGKFGYMSPEQLRGLDIDSRTDVFSTGICMWELATTERLFAGENEMVILQKIRQLDPPPPSSIHPDVPKELDKVILRALAKNPEERYGSAKELYRELTQIAQTTHELASRVEVAVFMQRWFPEVLEASGSPLKTDSGELESFPTQLYAKGDSLAPRADKKMTEKNKDLDLFEGIGKKSVRPASPSAPPAPPNSSRMPAAPVSAKAPDSLRPPPPPGGAPNSSGGARSNPPSSSSNLPTAPVTTRRSDPPSGRASAPPPIPGASVPPPPASQRPNAQRPSGSQPAARASNPPPLPIPGSAASGNSIPPDTGSVTSLGALPRPPASAPPAAAASAPVPPSTRPMTGERLDWDDDEATHVLDKTTDDVKPYSAPAPAAGAPAVRPSLIPAPPPPAGVSGAPSARASAPPPLPPTSVAPPVNSAPPPSGRLPVAKTGGTLPPPPGSAQPPPLRTSNPPPPPPMTVPGGFGSGAPPAGSLPPPPNPFLAQNTTLPAGGVQASSLAAALAPPARSVPPPPPPGTVPSGGLTPPPASVAPPPGTQRMPPPPPGGSLPPNTVAMHQPFGQSVPPPGVQPVQQQPSVPPYAGAYAPPHAPAQAQPQGLSPEQVHTEPMAMPERMPSHASRIEATQVVRRPSSPLPWVFAILGLGALAAVGGYFALSGAKTGKLALKLVDAKGVSVDRADIFVDGKSQCQTSPCTVDNLSAGTHNVKVMSGDRTLLDREVTVNAGAEAKETLTVQTVSKGSLRASSTQTGLKVKVDGREIGSLPLDLKDVAPGDHKIRFYDSEDPKVAHYEPLEKNVAVTDGVQDLGVVSLKLVKATVKIVNQTPGANITLILPDGAKAVPEKNQNVPISVDPNLKTSVKATKAGFDEFEQVINFHEGSPDKTIEISLSPKGSSQSTTSSQGGGSTGVKNTGGGTKTTPTTPKTPEDKPVEPPKTEPTVKTGGGDTSGSDATGEAKLTMNSIPASSIVLDGKPIGQTPKKGYGVSAGSHTIVFVNAEQGLKKTVQISVNAGETKPVLMKLHD